MLLTTYPMGVYNFFRKDGLTMEKENCCRFKKKERDEKIKKDLTVRLNRINGQVEGIKKMIDDNRYCADILIQISAVKKALESVGYIIMENHLQTCVTDEILEGNKEITHEIMDLFKKL